MTRLYRLEALDADRRLLESTELDTFEIDHAIVASIPTHVSDLEAHEIRDELQEKIPDRTIVVLKGPVLFLRLVEVLE